MRAFPPSSRLAPLLGALLLPLMGCAEPGLRGGDPFLGAPAGPASPVAAGRDLPDLRESLRELRRGLANQEERIEEARKAIQALADGAERGRRASEEALKKLGQQLDEVRGRMDTLEGELALLRASARGRGASPGEEGLSGPAGAPSAAAAAVGVPQSAPGGEAEALAAGVPRAEQAPPAGLPADAPRVATAPGAPPAPLAPPSVAKLPDPEEEFNEALRVLREERSFPRARALLSGFIAKHPTHELADDAQYWIGMSYFEEKNFERAILAFNKVQVDYANSDKAPDALLQEALSFLSLGDRASARELLGRVVGKYPNSDAAKTAIERLKSF